MNTPNSIPKVPSKAAAARNFLIGGLLPVIAFTVVEEVYGTMGGLIAGIVFGAAEMIWEYWRERRVQKITIGANLLVVVLGLVSLYEGSGIWFKMQPAILLFAFSIFLLGSSLVKKPFLVAMARKQNPSTPEAALELLAGMNFRISFVFLGLTALSVYAALHWSTAAWATLKGVGVPIVLFVYMAIEVVVIRILRKPQVQALAAAPMPEEETESETLE